MTAHLHGPTCPESCLTPLSPMTRAERNAVEPLVYQAADDECPHETYAPCDACLRAAVRSAEGAS